MHDGEPIGHVIIYYIAAFEKVGPRKLGSSKMYIHSTDYTA